MKKLLFAAAALAALAGCAKNEVNIVENDSPITFQTVVGTIATKLIDGTAYPTGETFGTAAFYNAEGTSFGDNNDTKAYILESEVKYNSTQWSTEIPYYWPKSGSLSFFSYSPWDELNAVTDITKKDGIIINSWDVNAKQDVDVMVADFQTGQKANGTNSLNTYNGVPTVFRHKLTQIVGFNLKSTDDYPGANDNTGKLDFYINNITLNNIKTVGTYTSKSNVSETVLGEWVPTTSTTNYTWLNFDYNGYDNDFTKQGTDFKYDTNKDYLLVLPQTFDDNATISMQYTIRHWSSSTSYVDEINTTSMKLKDLHNNSTPLANAWNMNKKIRYNITIGPGEQILWAPEVAEWGEETIVIPTL